MSKKTTTPTPPHNFPNEIYAQWYREDDGDNTTDYLLFDQRPEEVVNQDLGLGNGGELVAVYEFKKLVKITHKNSFSVKTL